MGFGNIKTDQSGTGHFLFFGTNTPPSGTSIMGNTNGSGVVYLSPPVTVPMNTNLSCEIDPIRRHDVAKLAAPIIPRPIKLRSVYPQPVLQRLLTGFQLSYIHFLLDYQLT